jgi:hypothetical protein
MTSYIGIDIGLDGAISVINEEQKIKQIIIMPIVKGVKKLYDLHEIVKIIRKLQSEDDVFMVIEKPTPRPIISCSANFMLGGGLFLFEAIAATLNISYQVVTARTWQKDLLKGLSKDTKTASIMFCKRKWPYTNLKKNERCRKDHDGISDSLCIALYCYRLNR